MIQDELLNERWWMKTRCPGIIVYWKYCCIINLSSQPGFISWYVQKRLTVAFFIFYTVISAPLLDVLASAASEQSPLPASTQSLLTTPLQSASQVSSTPNVWPLAAESESSVNDSLPVAATLDRDNSATARWDSNIWSPNVIVCHCIYLNKLAKITSSSRWYWCPWI